VEKRKQITVVTKDKAFLLLFLVLSESESPNKEEKIFEILFSERFDGNASPNNFSDEGIYCPQWIYGWD
jgi:hypothetical protein